MVIVLLALCVTDSDGFMVVTFQFILHIDWLLLEYGTIQKSSEVFFLLN